MHVAGQEESEENKQMAAASEIKIRLITHYEEAKTGMRYVIIKGGYIKKYLA